MKYFHFGVWSISYNCLHDTTRNETHCGCYFIAVILTEMKFHFGWWNTMETLPDIKSYETSKFEWTIDDSWIENIISTPIWATIFFIIIIIFFFEVSALLDVRHCPKLLSCAISRKTNDATFRKWQKPYFHTEFGGRGMSLTSSSSQTLFVAIILCNF